jgi:hypothetical protein
VALLVRIAALEMRPYPLATAAPAPYYGGGGSPLPYSLGPIYGGGGGGRGSAGTPATPNFGGTIAGGWGGSGETLLGRDNTGGPPHVEARFTSVEFPVEKRTSYGGTD